MSSGLIRMAVPTDEEAIEYLKSSRPADDFKITPLKAKSMYPDKITSNKHFKCPTDGCNAPVTCRSIRVTNVNQPAFVDQYRSVNKHAEYCQYHPDNYEQNHDSYKSEERKSSHYGSGNTFSNLTRLNGFVPLKEVKRNASFLPQTNEGTVQMSKVPVSEREKSEKTESKEISHHLNTLQEHVELFIDNPEFKVLQKNSSKGFPIKYMFKNIYRNVLYKDLSQKSYLNIYMDKAFLSKTSNEKVLAIRFRTKVRIEGDDYKPSMIISKDYFENEYEDIYADFISGNQLEFDVYTTLPFRMNGSYLNFSSYASDINVYPFGKEIQNNFYIR